MIAWVACIVILLSSLAPSISHALAAPGTLVTIWSEICAAEGIKNLEAANEARRDSSSPAKQSLHLDDCPYCRLQADAPGFLPGGEAALFIVDSSFPFPFLFYQSPRPLFVWASARPRGPPSFS